MDERYAHMWQFLLSRPTRRRIITYECTSHISKIINPEIICKEVTRPVWGHTCVRGISILLCDQNFNVVNNPRFSPRQNKGRVLYTWKYSKFVISCHHPGLPFNRKISIFLCFKKSRYGYYAYTYLCQVIYSKFKKIKSSSMWKCDV